MALAVGACDNGDAVRPRASDDVRALGPSRLTELGLDIEATRLGQVGGGPDVITGPVQEPQPADLTASPFVFTGADVYRLTCRACHGREGKGAPPEIGSLIEPVRATSEEHLQQRAKEAGREIPEAMLAELTADAERSLKQRIAEGGEKMPAFDYLDERERQALWEHLRVLAGVQRTRPTRLTLSVGRVGELLVRGTCHICHDAQGPGSHHAMMMRGITPSLESLTERPPGLFLEKTREGEVSGPGPMRHMMGRRSRMPAYPYLTPAEIAAAYRFLFQ